MDRVPPASKTGSEYRIRSLRVSDRAAIEAMYSTFEPLGFAKGLPPTPGEKTSRWLSYLFEHCESLVAEDAGGFAGHAIVAESGEAAAEIAVFVHQAHRRRGLGQALMGAAVEHARGRGCQRIWATASPGNEAAIRMVKGCGFRVVSERGAGEVELEWGPREAGAGRSAGSIR